MYILFEKSHSDGVENLYDYDCMGYAKTEDKAREWVNENSEYRKYKYCPDKEI